MDHSRPLSLNRLALSATLHCLSGCAIGEALGMVLGTTLGWSNGVTVVVAIGLAFLFGYALTMRPLLQAGTPIGSALRLALAADSLSITVMELVDNAVMLAVPNAMNAALDRPLFWISLIASLALAGLAAWPINRWLIARGRGHAMVHGARGSQRGHGLPHDPAGSSRH